MLWWLKAQLRALRSFESTAKYFPLKRVVQYVHVRERESIVNFKLQVVVVVINRIVKTWYRKFNARVVRNSKYSHDDHVQQEGSVVNGEQKWWTVENTIVPKGLHGMNIHVIPRLGGFIEVVVLVERGVECFQVHEPVPVVFNNILIDHSYASLDKNG